MSGIRFHHQLIVSALALSIGGDMLLSETCGTRRTIKTSRGRAHSQCFTLFQANY